MTTRVAPDVFAWVPRAVVFTLLAFVIGAFVLGRMLRADMALDVSAESVQAYVLGLGFKAPLIFVALVTFRNFLLLPSMVVLTAGGLVFGAADPKAGYCGSLGDLVRDPRLNHRLEVTGGVLEEECGELLKEFFARLRRRDS